MAEREGVPVSVGTRNVGEGRAVAVRLALPVRLGLGGSWGVTEEVYVQV